MAKPFFRETRAVQKRTVFGDAPCLKLSVDGYICHAPRKVRPHFSWESGGDCDGSALGCRIRYDDSFIDNWFSDLEINQILLLKALIDGDYNRYGGVLDLLRIMTPGDDYTWLHKPIPPAFHENKDCPFMHSNYENFRFPANFKEL